MRIANLDGRAVLCTSETEGHDIATVSEGQFGPGPNDVLEQWDAFTAWAKDFTPTTAPVSIDRARLGPPSPRPSQVLAIGLNYAEHAAESGMPIDDTLPPVFAKFASSLAGPSVTVSLPPNESTDWEVELVAVIGRGGRNIAEADAWDHIAGLTVGQDISDRTTQFLGTPPQFGLGKSYANFSPTGPWIVTTDELREGGLAAEDLELGCAVDEETVQQGRTKDMIHSVPKLVAMLSAVVGLNPGDLIFTGTPSGVGWGREPKRFLRHGERLRSWIEGIGEIEQTFVDPRVDKRA